MKRQMKWIWNKLGSIHLTVVLCLLLTADLAWGYICLNRRVTLFAPLNDIGLATWLDTYGRHNIAHTAWFFLLLGLLALLCVNTFVCTTERALWLVQKRKRFGPRRLLFKFAPHVMHYAMIVILAGYLCSYLFSQVLDTRTLVPGKTMTLPGTQAQITFTAFNPVYYKGDRLPAFKNRVLQPNAGLLLTNGEHRQSKTLSLNRPVRFQGYYIVLKSFSPKKKGGLMSTQARISLSIRKDPGVRFYLAGVVLFTLGLLIYLFEWMAPKKRKTDKDSELNKLGRIAPDSGSSSRRVKGCIFYIFGL
jgi:cytochrome c biogenesis protein ResB